MIRAARLGLFWAAAVASLVLAAASARAATESERSTEHPSPMGIYEGLAAHSRFTSGTDGAGAQSEITVYGDLYAQPLDADAPLEGNASLREFSVEYAFFVGSRAFKTNQHAMWGSNSAYFGVNVSPAEGIESELHVGGPMRAYGFRASQAESWGNNDELLYFTAAGDSVEMGARRAGNWADPQSICRLRAHPMIVLNYYSGGNVGVGTTLDPAYAFQVGDPGSGLVGIMQKYGTFSSRTYKTDITPVSPAERADLARKVSELNVVRFRRKTQDARSPKTLGLVAEEAPSEIVAPDGKRLGHASIPPLLFAAIERLKAENDALEAEVVRLERELGVSRGSAP